MNKITGDALFRKLLLFSGISIVIFGTGIFLTLLMNAFPSIKSFGFRFLYEKEWDPVFNNFGALPFIVGTLSSSFLALLISIPFSLSISIFLGEYFKKGVISSFLQSIIELLAGIPSVIYGFWGLFLLVPLVRELEMKIGITPYGVGIFTASLVLSIMIIPYSASIGKEVIKLVPQYKGRSLFSWSHEIRGNKKHNFTLFYFRNLCRLFAFLWKSNW